MALVKIRFSALKMKVTCLTSGTNVCVFFQWPADAQWWKNQFLSWNFYLIHVTKKEKYESIDKRLQCFIDEMTKKNGHRSTSNDNTNYKYNVLENIMKSRNNNYVSQIGISENIICHFGSNKCKYNTQVLNKLGGKGSM